MTKAERINYINMRAIELADTGDYAGYQSIEHALRAEGFPEARGELDSPTTRKLLDDACASARARKDRLSGGNP
ncbi:MAG: hypothetical protein KGJ57_15320 [Sphingomonadales bacterium]|nr:hypothetical protein [Sphingomonadales bacterium]MDE2170774.1 hypothetical protein [Sphingomonadales bacterium]